MAVDTKDSRVAVVVRPRLLAEALTGALRAAGLKAESLDSVAQVSRHAFDVAIITDSRGAEVDVDVVLRLDDVRDVSTGSVSSPQGHRLVAVPTLDSLLTSVGLAAA